ncbi:DNA/RNA endonuclease G (NUC1) [Paeniglutamicibacter psychrophenolicus]|nr:DNA/RNA endonuclease G (NUC1) [Paeniglutamicibacter psychrophenolicus]
MLWGRLPEANQANWDSFRYTNTTPQMDDFNQSSRDGLCGRLEVALHEDIDVNGLRVSVFGGPVFHGDDRIHRGTALRREYWTLVAFTDRGTPKARVFLPTQDLVQLRELPDLNEFLVYQATLAELEARTRNHFPGALHTAGIPATRAPGERKPQETAAGFRWQARLDHGRAVSGFVAAWVAGPGIQSEVGC